MTEIATPNKSHFSLTESKIQLVELEGATQVKTQSVPDDRNLVVTKEDLTVSEPVTAEKIIEKLETYGGCFVRNYLPVEDTAQILADMRPYLDEDEAWKGESFPSETRRAARTCVKSKTAAEKMLVHPLNLAVSDHFLAKKNHFVVGNHVTSGYSPAQHNSTITFDIGPGARDQVLHRDDFLHHNIRRKMDKFELGRETAVGTVVALSRTNKANGATRFIPGSHLWDHFRIPKEEECVYAELEVGDCFFMLASCFHGGSANTTTDEHRIVTILFMTQGTLRQEENVFLGTPIEYFRSLSTPVLKALGLTVSDPFCGHYDLKNPLQFIKSDALQEGEDDLVTEYFPIAV